MPIFIDQLNREIMLEVLPSRIISLVPSQTELLCDLNLEDCLVGITKFCVHPTHVFRSKTRVGGTKQFDFEAIAALRPDLIVANKEENPKVAIEKLAESYPVWISDVDGIDSAIRMVSALGKINGQSTLAEALAEKTSTAFSKLKSQFSKNAKLRCLYLIWKNPYMAAGSDTFISDVMRHIGLENVLTERGVAGMRYPKLSEADISELKPDIILLSSEPYPFKETDVGELRNLIVMKSIVADGEAFSWDGSRMIKSVGYLSGLSAKIHEEFMKRNSV